MEGVKSVPEILSQGPPVLLEVVDEGAVFGFQDLLKGRVGVDVCFEKEASGR